VTKNLSRLKDHVEQMALLEEKHREFLLNNTIMQLLNLRDTLKAKQKVLDDWVKRHDAIDMLRLEAITEYRKLMTAVEQFQVNRDMTPRPENDPLLRWQHYRSLRDTWINDMNNLQFCAILHREECKKIENLFVDSLQTIIFDYITTTKSHNLKTKAIFGKHVIPFDADQEWQHFVSENMGVVVPTAALELSQPRKLLFKNDEHRRTRPLAEEKLFLDPMFPWSFRSQRKLKKYIVTHGGYFMKVQEDETKSPLPTRAFKLIDCVVLELPPHQVRDGTRSFVIKGSNCCRNHRSNIVDRRTVWRFTGSEKGVKELLAVIRQKLPVFGYRPYL
jgi:hypothetical protein